MNHDLTGGEGKDDSVLSKAVEKAKEEQTKEKSAVEQVTNQVFQLYANFLSE